MARFWLRDDQFERIEALLPGKRNDPGRTAANNRLFVEAVLWIARTGSPWRDLPPEFGLWNSAYQRFARWSRQGVKSKICCKFSSIQSMTNGFLAREGNNVVALSGGDSGSHPFGVFTHIQVSPFLPNFVFLGQ